MLAFQLHCSPFLSLPDESEHEVEKGRQLTQEEQDIDVIRSWVEVGGHPACQEGEAKELLSEVSHIPSFSPLPPFFFFFFFF